MRRALIIGVQSYTGGYSPKIGPAVAADVGLMRRALAELGVTVVREIGTEGEEVTSDAIKNAVARFILDAATDDDLIVYFSGHGRYFDGVSYMVPSTADPRLPDQAGYLVPIRFETEIDLCVARSVTFLVDACRDGDKDGGAHRPPAPSAPATTFVFAAQPSRTAGIPAAHSAGSVFTRALTELLPSLPATVRLEGAVAQLQQRVDRLCDLEGLPRQQVDEVSNVDRRTAPFPLFAAAPSTGAHDRWSRALKSRLVEASNTIPPAQIGALLDVADRLDHSSSLLFLAGVDNGELPATPWIEPGLPDRLARAVADLGPLVLSSDFQQLTLVGVVAAVEAALRAAELSLLRGEGDQTSVECVLAAEPGLRRAVTDTGTDTGALHQWVVHLAAVRECAVGQAGDLRTKLSEVVYALAPDLTAAAATRATDHLLLGIRAAFDTGQAVTELRPSFDIELEPSPVRIDLHRLSVTLHLVWLFALDSRLFPPETGLHLANDTMPVGEALGALNQARWQAVQNLLELRMWNLSAPLDLALREVCAEINHVLLLHRQSDGSLEGTAAPHAATPSRLLPDTLRGAEKRPAYRLPHIVFQVSASETQALLMGTNLYQDASLAVREVYQNAIDACNYRHARMTHRLASDDLGWTPEIQFKVGEEDGRRYIECRDNGIGMSDHELREAFAKAGRRFRDLPEFIEESNEWATDPRRPGFQPISQFGIGVFSYFMIAEELHLLTTRLGKDLSAAHSLRVRIRHGSTLFQVREAEQVEPVGGGTIVRLFLHPEMQDFDLMAALCATVRAPTIRVTFGDKVWEAGRLYYPSGDEARAFTAAGDLGIYLHEGLGTILINGIPQMRSFEPLTMGCTISLGAWARPELSVDRRALLSFDLGKVRDRLRQAAAMVAEWPDATANWVMQLFQADAAAGVAAYRKLASRELPLHPDHSSHHPSDCDVTSISLTPEIHGLYRDDPGLLHSEKADTILGAIRLRMLGRRGSEHRRRRLQGGVPRFDERLATLAAGPTPIELLRLSGGYGGAPQSDNRPERFTATSFKRNRPLSELMDMADSLGVTLGALATFAWAVGLLESPRALSLTRSASRYSRHRKPEVWRELRESPLKDLPILARDFSFAFVPLIQAATGRTAIQPATVTPYAEALPVDLPEARVRLFSRLDALVPTRHKRFEFTRADWEMITSANHTIRRGGKPSSERPLRTSDRPPAGLSAAATAALSRDADESAPYFTEVVPATHVALAAVDQDEPSAALPVILDELTRAGFRLLPPDVDWDAMLDAVHECPALYREMTYSEDEPIEDVIDLGDLGEIEEGLDELGWTPVWRSLRALDRAILGRSSALSAIIDLNLPSMATVRRHARVLTRPFREQDLTVGTLVAMAAAEGGTYGAALRTLIRYVPLSRSSQLPDTLPPELAEVVPDPLTVAYFQDAPWDDVTTNGAHWAMRAVRLSAIDGAPLRTIAEKIEPLLTVGGQDPAVLRRVGTTVGRRVVFDDLLVLGCLQLTPRPDDPADIVALCRPFAATPTELPERASVWLRADIDRMSEHDWPTDRLLFEVLMGG